MLLIRDTPKLINKLINYNEWSYFALLYNVRHYICNIIFFFYIFSLILCKEACLRSRDQIYRPGSKNEHGQKI